MKKIAAGYYSEYYKGISIKVIKNDSEDLETSEIQWYFIVKGGKFGEATEGGEDFFSTKKDARAAAIEFIDNSEFIAGLGWCYTGK